MPRDPLVPVTKAVDEFAAARAAIDLAKEDARALIQRARDHERAARAVLHQRMVDAALDGVRQVDLIRVTGYTREAVRRILRAGGVEPD
jgi:hypothetical protein